MCENRKGKSDFVQVAQLKVKAHKMTYAILNAEISSHVLEVFISVIELYKCLNFRYWHCFMKTHIIYNASKVNRNWKLTT